MKGKKLTRNSSKSIMVKTSLRFLFLLSLCFPIVSCSRQVPIHVGQDYAKVWKFLYANSLPNINIYGYTFFKYGQKSYVVKQTADYSRVDKIKSYQTRKPMLSDFDKTHTGMNIFEVTKIVGVPGAIADYQMLAFRYNTVEDVKRYIFFNEDSSFILNSL